MRLQCKGDQDSWAAHSHSAVALIHPKTHHSPSYYSSWRYALNSDWGGLGDTMNNITKIEATLF